MSGHRKDHLAGIPGMRSRLFKNLGSIVGLCLFCVAAYVIHRELRGYHLHNILDQINRVSGKGLAGAVGVTILNYLILTGVDVLGLRYVRHPLAYHRIALASFIGYVFSNNITVVGGSAARYRVYSALGVSANEVAELVLFCGLTFWLGFFTVAGVVFLLEPRNVPQELHLPFQSIWLLGVIFLLVTAAYLVGTALKREPMKIRGWRFRIPSPAISAGQLAISSLDWLLAAAVLYLLLPQGGHIGFMRFVGVFVLAQAAGLLSYVPAGLGVFETVFLLSLSDTGNAAGLTASLVLYRLVYYILPLIAASLLLTIHEILPHLATVKRIGLHLSKWGSLLIPQVFALAVFIAGAILLFSGALPPVRGRFEIVRELLPLPAIELSHFMASLTGAALLVLARGLQRRLDGAYHITVILLGAGAFFSLVKGLDYEEAFILSVMLAALVPCRSQFHRKASLTSLQFSPGWIALIAVVLACSAWLGLFAYKHVEYSNQLWWRFAFHGDAPRFLRATAGAAALLVLYGATRFLKPARPESLAPSPASIPRVQTIVRASRKTYANLALVGDKQFLFSQDERAFIMYAVEGRSWVSMGGPVGPQDTYEELAWKFVELCDQYDGQPVFYQIESQDIDLYVNLGMTFQKLGEEARVSLPEFGLEGGARRNLRLAINRVTRQGYTFEILPVSQVPVVLDKLEFVSNAWLEQKNTREKGFSLGFFHRAYISQCPVAIVRNEAGISAFANLWLGAEKEELSLDLMRYLPDAPESIMDYLFVQIMLWGKQEGYRWFNLGMAPLSGLEAHAL
ncbi:MAG: bifunctional lysylphosphatidylglycerol flippase/synthetase MprF, partial [Caldisericales bacterium]|nr:bifunctional lysylphosphatidylglycerol flippase/synthetase MprF [Caldisericales bacterium]